MHHAYQFYLFMYVKPKDHWHSIFIHRPLVYVWYWSVYAIFTAKDDWFVYAYRLGVFIHVKAKVSMKSYIAAPYIAASYIAASYIAAPQIRGPQMAPSKTPCTSNLNPKLHPNPKP